MMMMKGLYPFSTIRYDLPISKNYHHHHHHLILKVHEKSKSIQIKAGTTRQETALTVALKININTSIKHQTVNQHTICEKHNSKNKVGRS